MSGDASEPSITGSVVSGFSEFLHVVGLWFAFSAVFNPLSTAVNAALVAEPFSFGRLVVLPLSVAAVAVTHARYPEISAFRLWVVGIASTALFFAAAFLAGPVNAPTSGSLVVVVRLLLLWLGSVCASLGLFGYHWGTEGETGFAWLRR